MKPSWLLSGLVTLLLVPATYAAEVNRSWEKLVDTLKPGKRVVVVQHSRKQVEGKLLSLDSGSIAVEVRGQPLTVQREEVFRVRVADIRQKRTLIGLGIGFAVGAIIGGTGADRYKGATALFGGGVAGGIGAAAGGVIPIGKPLYEAPGGLRETGP